MILINSIVDNGQGTLQLVTAHLVPGSYSAGPYPARTDQPYTFLDTVGNPGMMYQVCPYSLMMQK
jgi:hypothetical protein